MNYQYFIEALPEFYENWGQPSVRPHSDQFSRLLEQVPSPTSANTLQLLNWAISCLESQEVYCEISTQQGANLIAALLNHQSMAYAVNPGCENGVSDQAVDSILNILSDFHLVDQVFFCQQDLEAFFADLAEMESEDRIGVFFLDAVPDYRSQLMALLLVRPFLADRALLLLSHSDWEDAQQAHWDFLATHPQGRMILDFSAQELSNAWNGLQVVFWDITQTRPNDRPTYQLLRNAQVIQSIQRLGLTTRIEALLSQAAAWRLAGDFQAAAKHYQQVLALDASYAESWHQWGLLFYEMGKYTEALPLMTQSLELQPASADYHFHFGLVLEKVGNLQQAIGAYRMAITLNPRFTDAYNNLGNLLLKTGDLHQAETIYRQSITVGLKSPQIFANLGNILCQLGQDQKSVEVLEAGLKDYPKAPELLAHLAFTLAYAGNASKAICIASEALAALPSNFFLKMIQNLMLPILYETAAEIDLYRHRYETGLELLLQEISLASPEARENALLGIGSDPYIPFYLAAQGKNDLEIQRQYGLLIHRIMAANYPQWVMPLSINLRNANSKIRVGYVSAFMQNHTVGKLFLGWLRHHNHTDFEVNCYYLRHQLDSLTEEFQQYSDRFWQIPDNLEEVCQQILTDQLDILVYLDIGMEAQPTQMAGLRLAPIQCIAWGHPVTSGLPTIDYFLSNALMEPENAQAFYSEQLVCLPNIGVSYAKPQLPILTKTRSDFGLCDDAIIYLSCQSLHKYLPQHDPIFIAIAQRVPQAQFVFLSARQTYPTEQFRQRLQQAFSQAGLNSEEFCVILPRQSETDYWNLNAVSDIFLDTLGWSGGNTTLEAIACGLPIVTYPGELMRGRHSYGILNMLGVTDTIASSESEYIDIAVRLGLDSSWRCSIVERMKLHHPQLFDDKLSVEGLEAFYKQAVQNYQGCRLLSGTSQ